MLKFMYYGFIFIAINKISVKCTKIWIENSNNLMNPTNWVNGLLPCDYDNIIFPKLSTGALILSDNITSASLILPIDGALIFGESFNAELLIALSNGIEKDYEKNQKCKNENNLAKLKTLTKSSKFWFDPENWKTNKININSATPDLEKIPCSYDNVILPRKGNIFINFENLDNLEVNGIEMGVNSTQESFQNDLYTDLAHIIFENADDFNVIFKNDDSRNNLCSCHDPKLHSEYEKKVCSHVKNHCTKNYPKCLNPIKPYGHCCEICGSTLKMMIDDCVDFDLQLFKQHIENEIKNEGLEEYLDYYASKINDGSNYYVQLIVSDKNNYNELSVSFINKLKSFFQRAYASNSKSFYLSGIKYDKNNPEHPWKFIFLPLLFTILFFILMYAHYIKGSINYPSWLHYNRLRFFNSSNVFARFDNNQGELEIAENLSRPPIRIEAIIENQDAGDNANIPYSFDNPMFEENLEVPNTQNVENVSLISDSSELTMICLDEN